MTMRHSPLILMLDQNKTKNKKTVSNRETLSTKMIASHTHTHTKKRVYKANKVDTPDSAAKCNVE